MAQILSGNELAKSIKETTAKAVIELNKNGIKAKLCIICANNDPSSKAYVRSLVRSCEKIGISSEVIDLSEKATQSELNQAVLKAAKNKKIHGIIIQTPLPRGVSKEILNNLVPVEKDVDGINPSSAGLLAQNQPSFAPATAQAVIELLKFYKIDVASKKATIIGRSNVIGKPVAQLLLNLDATITVCHSKSVDLESIAKDAEILVVAVGKANFIDKNYVNKNQTVVDVGINFDRNGYMVGDVNFEKVEPHVKALTPVPGGIGPVTTAILLKHTCESAQKALK